MFQITEHRRSRDGEDRAAHDAGRYIIHFEVSIEKEPM
jgi:hypothetical protein